MLPGALHSPHRVLAARAAPRNAKRCETRDTGRLVEERTDTVLGWAFLFLLLAIVAAVLGFGGIAGAAAGIAQILFVVFLVLLIVAGLARALRGSTP